MVVASGDHGRPGTIEPSETERERARRGQLLTAMRARGADRHGITVHDLATALGWDHTATAACLAAQAARGTVCRMGHSPTGAVLFTTSTPEPA